MPVSVGEAFAGFTILRVLGAGGMGTVYLAAHPRLPRQDALKVLPAQWTADPQYRARSLLLPSSHRQEFPEQRPAFQARRRGFPA